MFLVYEYECPYSKYLLVIKNVFFNNGLVSIFIKIKEKKKIPLNVVEDSFFS